MFSISPAKMPGFSQSNHPGQFGSVENLVIEGNTFRIILGEPGFRGIVISEHLDVLGVANLLGSVDVDKGSHMKKSWPRAGQAPAPEVERTAQELEPLWHLSETPPDI